jgi:hypothetical protein
VTRKQAWFCGFTKERDYTSRACLAMDRMGCPVVPIMITTGSRSVFETRVKILFPMSGSPGCAITSSCVQVDHWIGPTVTRQFHDRRTSPPATHLNPEVRKKVWLWKNRRFKHSQDSNTTGATPSTAFCTQLTQLFFLVQRKFGLTRSDCPEQIPRRQRVSIAWMPRCGHVTRHEVCTRKQARCRPSVHPPTCRA